MRDVFQHLNGEKDKKIKKEKKMKKITIMFTFLFVTFFTACAIMPAPRPQVQNPVSLDLEYNIPKQTQEAMHIPVLFVSTQDSGVSIARYQDDFRSSLTNDIEKLLIAKGYTVKLQDNKPFADLNSMTYEDKTQAILALVPYIQGKIGERIVGQPESEGGSFRNKSCRYRVELFPQNFKIELDLIEPMSGEKIWTKTITPDASDINGSFTFYTSASTYGATTVGVGEHVVCNLRDIYPESNGEPSAIAAALNAVYPKILDTINKYLDPREIKIAMEYAKKARERARFAR